MHYLINSSEKVRKGLESLNQKKIDTLIVLNEFKKVIGTTTDGDIRRYLLNGGTLDDNIEKACNKTFNYCHSSSEAATLFKNLRNDKILSIPILKKDKTLIEVLNYGDTINPSDTVALIMAGGLGKRLRPLTDTIPKPLLPIRGEPIIKSIIRNIESSGMKKVFISIKYLGDQIKDYLGDGSDYGIDINYLEEEKALGTAGCLSMLPENINTIFTINGDISTDLSFKWLVNYHHINNSTMTVATRMYKHKVPFGVICLEGDDIKNIEEKPTKSYPIAGGIYVINYEKFKKLNKYKRPEYLDMPDLISFFIDNKEPVRAFLIHEKWYDVGDVKTYEELNKT
mgnify:CR=1 FL=1|tara:strand:+ start:522 stop:1541 length:1020 start_codon:yes stop_codon:yes gene_type:complete